MTKAGKKHDTQVKETFFDIFLGAKVVLSSFKVFLTITGDSNKYINKVQFTLSVQGRLYSPILSVNGDEYVYLTKCHYEKLTSCDSKSYI